MSLFRKTLKIENPLLVLIHIHGQSVFTQPEAMLWPLVWNTNTPTCHGCIPCISTHLNISAGRPHLLWGHEFSVSDLAPWHEETSKGCFMSFLCSFTTSRTRLCTQLLSEELPPLYKTQGEEGKKWLAVFLEIVQQQKSQNIKTKKAQYHQIQRAGSESSYSTHKTSYSLTKTKPSQTHSTKKLGYKL